MANNELNLDAKRVEFLEARLTVMVDWLEKNEPSVWSRGIWDAINAAAPAQGEPSDALPEMDLCAFENAIRNLEYIEDGRYPAKDHDLDGSFVTANIGHAKKLARAVLPRLRAAYSALCTSTREVRRESRISGQQGGGDAARLDWLNQQGVAYGFEDLHEGTCWTMEGPFANVRTAIDAGMAHDAACVAQADDALGGGGNG